MIETTEPPKWATISTEGVLTLRTDDPTLDALREAVDGDLEAIRSPLAGTTAMFNEAKVASSTGERLHLNSRGTALLISVLWPGVNLVGTLIIAGAADEDGDITDLPAEAVATLTERFG